MADDLVQQPQQQAPQQNQLVNVVGPDGDIGHVPQSQLSQLGDDYHPASQQEISDYQLQQQYGTTGQQVKTGLEGAASAATFGLSTGLERSFGVKPEDIRKRREANPVSNMVGNVAGLAGSMATGVGEANLLEHAGQAGVSALGLEGAGALSKIGSYAVKGAIENAMVQGGDEVSKMLSQDPSQTAGTAMLDIGLSGLMGGGLGAAFGTVNPLWKATVGDKVGGLLENLTKRVNGEAIPLTPEAEIAINQSGMQVPPAMRSGISDSDTLRNWYQTARESQTAPGLKILEEQNLFKKNAADNIVQSLGKSPDEIPNLGNISEADIGNNIKNKISSYIQDRLSPISKNYSNFEDKFKGTGFNDIHKNTLAEKIGNIINDERYNIYSDTPQAKLANQMLGAVPKIQTMEDLNKSISIINDSTKGFQKSDMWHIGGRLRQAFQEAQDQAAENILSTKAPEMLQGFRDNNAAYKSLRQDISELGDRLKLGNYGGPKGALQSLSETNPEDVIRRLNPSKDANLINFLNEKVPGVAQDIKEYHLNKMLGAAGAKAPEGHSINVKTLGNALDKMSPEMKKFVLPEGAEQKINATRKLLEGIPERTNPSGTAGTLSKLMSKIPSSTMAMIAALTGHNPAIGFLLGKTGEWLGRDAPDAIRVAMLKFLGHSGPVEPAAFKSMVEYVNSTMKGETMLSNGVKSIFKAGSEVLPRTQLPSQKDKKNLDKKIQEYGADNTKLMDTGGSTAYYLPDHGAALSQTAMAATNYLKSIRPSTDKLGILDPDKVPSQIAKSKYDRALDVAEQPLVALDSIKKGNLTSQDVVTLKTIHPGLYDRMSHKLMNQVMEQTAKEKSIPYKTRLGLSVFLMQPLDSSMTPQGISMNQMGGAAQTQTQQPQGPKSGPRNYKALNKLPGQYQTPEQSRALQRSEKS